MQSAQDAPSLQGGPLSVCVFKHLLFTGDAFISITVCMSNKRQCLLAQQNNKTHTDAGGGRGDVGSGMREEVQKELVLLLMKNEELVHIDRT